MKFVHAADLHIDSPMRGLEQYEGAPLDTMRGATRRALENLVALCIDEDAKLLLLAGDLFDGDWKDYATGLFFRGQMVRLRDAGVEVVWVRGNHDAASELNKHLRLPDNVRELSPRAAETVTFEALGVAVHGRGFAQRATTEDFARSYPAPLSGLVNLGLLHTSATGRAGHDPYAPTTLEILTSRGYDYFALGHIHEREVLCRDPWVVFPGNLQGRHVRESGPKGASLVTIAGGKIASVEHRALDVARWCAVEFDTTEMASAHEVLDGVRARLEGEVAKVEGRVLAVRVRLHGASAAHEELWRDPSRWRAELCAVASELSSVWLEKLVLATEPERTVEALGAADDALGHIASALACLGKDDARVASLVVALSELHNKLPSELRGDDVLGLALERPDAVRRLLPEVEKLLMARLHAAARQA
ncbi:MAG: DNA repair exonuclease [Myxococcales bacterium]|nr:DNA repair exonuclease [Myxococcales bacterium]